jgi:acetylornithine deacetylase/succinyl-diaminopimelate desuccinylase-like protein
MDATYRYIDAHGPRFVDEFCEFLKQPSISSQRVGLDDCARLLAEEMQRVGIHTEILPMGRDRAPLVYGALAAPGAQKTLLVYEHFDVQPPEPLELWETPPFAPSVRNGRVYARGSADDKGPLFAHLKALEALRETGRSPSVHLKFLFDPEEEIGSPNLEAFLKENRTRFAADLATTADGALDPSGRPTLTFGSRGNCYVEIFHQAANRDLHSGRFGGPVPNPNWRIIAFLNTLRDADGRVAIDGFYDNVLPATVAERDALSRIPFDEAGTLKDLGLKQFETPPGLGYQERIMFYPTMNICGFVSGYGGEGSKTVLPCKTRVKIDMRLVVRQDPHDIFKKFKHHMDKHGFEDLDVTLMTAYKPYRTSVDHPMAAPLSAALEKAFGKASLRHPSSGGSDPIASIVDGLAVPMIKIPYCNHDENNHSPNENLKVDHFIQGIKASSTVFCELDGPMS